MALRIQRAFTTPDRVGPGQYVAEPAPIVAGSKVTIGCPGCSKRTNLGNHVIERASGKVTPAFKCGDGCSFHEWIELDAWGPE